MKKAVLILLLLCCCFVVEAQKKSQKPQAKEATVTTANAADNEDEQPKLPPDLDMLRFFYIRYMVPFFDGSQPTELYNKQSQMRRRYCTERCMAQYLKLAQESEEDPFIKALNADREIVKSLQFAKKPNQPGRYTVTYDAAEKITIELGLVKEKDGWKIDFIY